VRQQGVEQVLVLTVERRQKRAERKASVMDQRLNLVIPEAVAEIVQSESERGEQESTYDREIGGPGA